MYHIFCIHSSIYGHLGFFHFLAIVKSAAVNIGVHVPFESCFSLDTCPVVELKGHMVALFFII